jgi:hypothetical protein
LLKALATHGIEAEIDPMSGATRLRAADITLTLAVTEQVVPTARRPPGRRTTVGDAVPLRPTAMLTPQVRHLPAKINPTLAAEGQSQQTLGRSPGPISKNACSDNFRGTE